MNEVKGLEEFIKIIDKRRSDINQNIKNSLINFIIESGCKSLKFEKLSKKALGISKPDGCILGTLLLDLRLEYFLYILLHEISHQYQYKKYGKNAALDIYTDIISLDDAVDKLMFLEKTADRLSIIKTKKILSDNGIMLKIPINPRYLNLEDTDYIKSYIEDIRKKVKENNYSTIEEINEHIYTTIK